MKIEFIIRTIYALCLIGAGLNHLITIITHGIFWDYYNAPILSRLFFTSLTVLDPIAAILLFLKSRVGLILTFLIILTDVIHNSGLLLYEGRTLLNDMFISQFIFLLFVMSTIRIPWNKNR